MGYAVFEFISHEVEMEPFEIAEDAVAPIGLDEYAWNTFRGAKVDEKGNVSLPEFCAVYDEDAFEVFVLMLAGRIRKGRIKVQVIYDGEPASGAFIEKDAAVIFGAHWTDIQQPLAPKGKALMRKVIAEGISHFRGEIERLHQLNEAVSEEDAA